MVSIAYLALGGCLGLFCRRGLDDLTARLFGKKPAWRSVLINLACCFLFGILFSVGDRTGLLGEGFYLVFMAGILCAFTVLSCFTLGQGISGLAREWPVVVANFLSTNIGVAIMVFLGMWLGETI